MGNYNSGFPLMVELNACDKLNHVFDWTKAPEYEIWCYSTNHAWT